MFMWGKIVLVENEFGEWESTEVFGRNRHKYYGNQFRLYLLFADGDFSGGAKGTQNFHRIVL